MSHPDPLPSRPEAGRYDIRIRGRLEPRWSSWFDGLTITSHRDGTTVIQGHVTDQAALHGLLQKVRDLGLPLISVTAAAPPPPSSHRPIPSN